LKPTEQERAKRYYEAASRDANRQIAIMAALVNTADQSYITEQSYIVGSSD